MSDLGQQGLFDTLGHYCSSPIWPRCVRLFRNGKAFCARRQRGYCVVASADSRASYYASREKDTPIKYEDEMFWHTVRYAAFCRALIRCIALRRIL